MLNKLDLIIAILINSGVISGAVFFLKKYVEKRLDHEFETRLEILKHEHAKVIEGLKADISSQAANSERLAVSRHTFYEQLTDVIYRIRNHFRDMRDIVARGNIARNQLDSLYNEYCSQVNILKECLYKARLSISSEAFRNCHEFKKHAVNYAIGLDPLISGSEDDICSDFETVADYVHLDELHQVALAQMRIEMGADV